MVLKVLLRFSRVVHVPQVNHRIVIIEKRIGMIIIFQNIIMLEIFLFKPVGHYRVFTLLFVDYPIAFDDNFPSKKFSAEVVNQKSQDIF